MHRPNYRRKRNTFFLLVACICFFVAGIAVLTLGAVFHVNPTITFASLFKLQPYINLVYTLIP